MKKITLLFATMLAMSGMAFGQKEGKVLWETTVESKPIKTGSGNDVSIYTYAPYISPSGNLLINYSYSYGYPDYAGTDRGNGKVYDKNGKILWKTSDYYKSITRFAPWLYKNKDYYNLNFTAGGIGKAYDDSLLLLDKEFKFQKSFDINSGGAFVVNVEDGFFYNNPQQTLLKYDASGKEEWQFDNKNAVKIITQKPPYLGLISTGIDKNAIIIFDKKGNKKGEIPSQAFHVVYPTSDNGFWLNTSPDLTKTRLIRYDSTGKELVNISILSVLTTFSDVNFRYDLLPDNSLIVAYLDANREINIVKIDEQGKTTKIQKDLGIKADFETIAKSNTEFRNAISYLKVAKDGTIIYGISESYIPKIGENPQKKSFLHFGGEKFNDTKFGWFKTITTPYYYINSFQLLSNDGNSVYIRSDLDKDGTGSFRDREMIFYQLNGELKWSYKTIDVKRENIRDNQIYIFQKSQQDANLTNLHVLDYETGKVLWKMDNILLYGAENGDYPGDVRTVQNDKFGNTYLQFYKIENYVYKLKFQVIKRDGSIIWQYNPPNYFNTFNVGDDGVIATNLEYSNSQLQLMLRKISPCNALNPISITGNTEACPTEKVKLSIPKEDGFTYQWQKDGKDIPNVKDVVYDFGESGTYTVVAKDEFCQNMVTSNALKVNIRTLPTAEVTAPKSIFCEGEKTVMTATTNGTFFQWQKDQKDIPNATSGIYEVSEAGNYRVGVRDDKCPQVGYSNVYTIITKLLPEANISTDIKGVVYEPFSVKMTANSGTGLAYQWLKDDVIIPNETSLTYEAKKSGKYKVNVTYDGCTKLSDALTISILIPLANQEEIVEEQVQVYPNPSKGEFKIILPKSLKSADIQLFDSFGREHSLVYVGEQAQSEGLTQGVYFLRVQRGERTVTNKIVIE